MEQTGNLSEKSILPVYYPWDEARVPASTSERFPVTVQVDRLDTIIWDAPNYVCIEAVRHETSS